MTHTPDTFIVRADCAPAMLSTDRALPAEVLGLPVKYAWKEVLRVNKYSHPKLGQIEFTRDDLDSIHANTQTWMSEGGRPYVPLGHTNAPERNMGWIQDTRITNGSLYALHALVGEEAQKAAARNSVSVCVRKNFKTSSGRVLPLVLEHSAIVSDPVATGLGGYVSLSRASGPAELGHDESAPVFTPSAAVRNPHMPTADELAMARDLLGQPDLAEDKVFGMLIEAASTASRYAGEAEEATVQLSRATEEITDLRGLLDKSKADVVTLSRSVPQVYDPEALTDRADAYMSRVELGVANGDIPPFIATGLKGVVLPKGKPSAYMLSRSEDFDGRPIDIVLDLFKGTGIAKKLAALGEQSGPQNLIPMSRTEPGTGDAPAADLPFKRMAETYNAKAADAK